MGRLTRVVTILVAVAGAVLPSGAAFADNTGTTTQRHPITSEPFSEPAGVVCPFQLDVSFSFQREVETDYFDATGTLVRSVVTGPLFAVFTNHNTGSSVERNASGLGVFDFHADGSATDTFTGHAGVGFHVGDSPSGKYLVFSGQAVVDVSATGEKTLARLDGTAEDMCQTLAH